MILTVTSSAPVVIQPVMGASSVVIQCIENSALMDTDERSTIYVHQGFNAEGATNEQIGGVELGPLDHVKLSFGQPVHVWTEAASMKFSYTPLL